MRLVKTLEEMAQYFGENRRCSVARELTKLFEENQRGTLREVADYFKAKSVKEKLYWWLQAQTNAYCNIFITYLDLTTI